MSLLRSASVVSALTLASRITGLVREQLIAAAFGASAATDATTKASRTPSFLGESDSINRFQSFPT